MDFQNALAFLSMEDGRHARRAQSGTRQAGRPSFISIVEDMAALVARQPLWRLNLET